MEVIEHREVGGFIGFWRNQCWTWCASVRERQWEREREQLHLPCAASKTPVRDISYLLLATFTLIPRNSCNYDHKHSFITVSCPSWSGFNFLVIERELSQRVEVRNCSFCFLFLFLFSWNVWLNSRTRRKWRHFGNSCAVFAQRSEIHESSLRQHFSDTETGFFRKGRGVGADCIFSKKQTSFCTPLKVPKRFLLCTPQILETCGCRGCCCRLCPNSTLFFPLWMAFHSRRNGNNAHNLCFGKLQSVIYLSSLFWRI